MDGPSASDRHRNPAGRVGDEESSLAAFLDSGIPCSATLLDQPSILERLDALDGRFTSTSASSSAGICVQFG
jgi:hypothetical protein